MSYPEFTLRVKQTLGMQIINNPLNKWGIFSRDFLLHLDSFNELLETDMESLKFVVDNMQKIQELVQLRDTVYQEIIDHINNALQLALGEEYEPNVRRNTWADNHPAIRFNGNNWNHKWTDTVLNLHTSKNPMSCAIYIHIENQTDEIVKKVKQSISKGKYPLNESRFERNKKFWCMAWKFNEFDLEKITQQIVFLHKILNRIEIERK